MANMIFEESTQIEATGFTGGDVLYFKTAAPTDIVVTRLPAEGLQVERIQLTVGDKTLTFAAAALGNGATIEFIATGGQIRFGTDGADALTVTSSKDSVVYAYEGADTIDVSGAGDHVINAEEGDDGDTIELGSAAGSTGAYLVLTGEGADTITLTADAEGNSTIRAGEGNDEVSANVATEGNLWIEGGVGDDTLVGGAGFDHIYGLKQIGAAGVTDGNDEIDAGDGNDYVNGNGGDDLIDGGAGSDRLFGGQGDDEIDGNTGNDSINGNKGDDTIEGGAGDDTVRGGQDDDLVQGDAGNDSVTGDLGDDTLVGGTGVDVLVGGAGDDLFVFADGDSDIADAVTVDTVTFYDTISDFSGDDVISFGGDDVVAIRTLAASFDTVTDAIAAAQAEYTASGADGDVFAYRVGADTYLIYDAGFDFATPTLDAIIKLTGVTAADLAISATDGNIILA